ncbi:MAG: hypothetical protein H7A23_11130 [Leptospiraceae bacterium]|nr:hypothetical protein [Leptospiraceae bacterium]MCP5495097.1 hypothetical protein [Leptospiraceae bacterium]
MKQIFFIVILNIFIQCKYTGGLKIVKGNEAIKKIQEKIQLYSYVGMVLEINGSFTCPSTSDAKFVTDFEPNDSYSQAQKFDFLSPTQDTRVQGVISIGNYDYDIFYTIVPNDTTYTKLYYRSIVKTGGECSIKISKNGESELSNTTTNYNNEVTTDVGSASGDETKSTDIEPGDYIFILCLWPGDKARYDLKLSLTDFEDSPSPSISNVFYSNLLLNSPNTFQISAGINKNKYYTRTSLKDCLSKLKTVVPLASIIDRYNFYLYNACEAENYTPVNPYFLSGWKCKLQEVDWIQVGDVGLP